MLWRVFPCVSLGIWRKRVFSGTWQHCDSWPATPVVILLCRCPVLTPWAGHISLSLPARERFWLVIFLALYPPSPFGAPRPARPAAGPSPVCPRSACGRPGLVRRADRWCMRRVGRCRKVRTLDHCCMGRGADAWSACACDGRCAVDGRGGRGVVGAARAADRGRRVQLAARGRRGGRRVRTPPDRSPQPAHPPAAHSSPDELVLAVF